MEQLLGIGGADSLDAARAAGKDAVVPVWGRLGAGEAVWMRALQSPMGREGEAKQGEVRNFGTAERRGTTRLSNGKMAAAAAAADFAPPATQKQQHSARYKPADLVPPPDLLWYPGRCGLPPLLLPP